jgi:hypothetical protein
LANGTRKPISEVDVGDEVLATDPETGETGSREVIATLPHTDQLLTLRASSGEIITTEDHKYWNATDQAWQESQHLDAGDRLLTADGDEVTIEGLDWTSVHFAAAYDLDVAGIDTYYVGAGDEAVLVHNCTPLTRGERTLLGSLADQADEKAFDVLRARGGGATNVRGAGLQDDMGQWTLRELAHAAKVDGNVQAERWIKMIKQAGGQGKGGK